MADANTIIQYLTILGLPLNKPIDKDAVKSQYRKLAKIYHPDSQDGHYRDGEKFEFLHEAYEYCSGNVEHVNRLIANGFKELAQQ